MVFFGLLTKKVYFGNWQTVSGSETIRMGLTYLHTFYNFSVQKQDWDLHRSKLLKEQKKKDDAQYRKKFDWRQVKKKFDHRRCRFIYGYRHAYQFCNNLLLHFFLKKKKKKKKKKKALLIFFLLNWRSEVKEFCLILSSLEFTISRCLLIEHYHNCLQMIKFRYFFFNHLNTISIFVLKPKYENTSTL